MDVTSPLLVTAKHFIRLSLGMGKINNYCKRERVRVNEETLPPCLLSLVPSLFSLSCLFPIWPVPTNLCALKSVRHSFLKLGCTMSEEFKTGLKWQGRTYIRYKRRFEQSSFQLGPVNISKEDMFLYLLYIYITAT